METALNLNARFNGYKTIILSKDGKDVIFIEIDPETSVISIMFESGFYLTFSGLEKLNFAVRKLRELKE